MNNTHKERLVKELYEKYPYPSREFISKKDSLYFAKWTANIIEKPTSFWKEKQVLDLGCGTGELACSLALFGAQVDAIDFSSASIKKAKDLAHTLEVEKNTHFSEKNILNYSSDKKFDCVIALGSLHHTMNARAAFAIAAKHVGTEGIIIIGLYNKYSRAKHRFRRIILRATCGNNIEKRIFFGKKLFGTMGNNTRDADKYGQVHESYHSVFEILKWFDKEGITFIASKPKYKRPIVDELKWLFLGKEAFFVMVGKKAAP